MIAGKGFVLRKSVLTFLVGLFLSITACNSSQTAYMVDIPDVHYPLGVIPLESLHVYTLAYCWRFTDARQSSYNPEEKEIDVVLRYGDGTKSSIIGNYIPQNSSLVYMLGCLSRDRQGIQREGNELAWRPNYDELTMVFGVDPETTNFKFFSVSESMEAEDLGEPMKASYQTNGENFYGKYFLNPTRLCWSPDGSKFAMLALDTQSGSGFNIWSIDMTTSSIVKISDIQKVGNYVVNASWSNDGKKIAVGYGMPYSGIGITTYGDPESYLEITSETNSDLRNWPYVLDSFIKMIFFNPTIQFNYYITELSAPIWIHYDTQIMFVAANNKQNAAFFIVNADGSGLHELLPGLPGIVGLPTLSPDGKTLAFIRYPSWKNRSRVEIATLDLETMELKSLVVLPAPKNGDELLISGMSWTPDGKYLAFSSPHGGESDIYVISRDGQAWVNLTADMNGDAVSPAWKP